MSEEEEIRRIAAEAGAQTYKELRQVEAKTKQEEVARLYRETKKERQLLTSVAITLTLLLVAGTIVHFPYGYYQFLRVAVCAGAALFAFISYKLRKEYWTFSMVGLALVYNPFFPVHLSRGAWLSINVLSGVLIMWALFVLLKAKQ